MSLAQQHLHGVMLPRSTGCAMSAPDFNLWYLGRGMYDTFNSQSKNIGELLGGNERAQIIVPKFQRGHSWLKKHIEAFWTDITTFQTESAVKGGPDKYFLGPIVILPESKETIRLLDGQQRLATATILFSVSRFTVASPMRRPHPQHCDILPNRL